MVGSDGMVLKSRYQYIGIFIFQHKFQCSVYGCLTNGDRFEVLLMILWGLLTANLPAGVDCRPSAAFIPYAGFTLMASSTRWVPVAVSGCLA